MELEMGKGSDSEGEMIESGRERGVYRGEKRISSKQIDAHNR